MMSSVMPVADTLHVYRDRYLRISSCRLHYDTLLCYIAKSTVFIISLTLCSYKSNNMFPKFLK